MRVVLIGLVGAILAVGGAKAAGCDLTAPMVASSRAQWASDVQRPDLIGKTFTVEKIASRWHAEKKSQRVALLLSVGGERFVTVRILDEQTDWVESFSADDADKMSKILWSRRDPHAEASDRLTPGIISDTDPLIHLYLEPTC